MRKKLLKVVNANYWVYGLKEQDFDFTIRLTEDFLKAIKFNYDEKAKKAQKWDRETAEEYIDDIAYYTFLDTKYILHFALWRLQAVFEGILFYTFIKPFYSENLFGLNEKLKKIKSIGYNLSDEEFKELIHWGKLRNILSHAPPEEFKPIEIEMKDILEYKNLVVKICKRFYKEKLKIKILNNLNPPSADM